MNEKHPILAALETTHADVVKLHPLLGLLDQETDGEDPLMILGDLLARIEIRLAAIEAVLSPPLSPESVEL